MFFFKAHFNLKDNRTASMVRFNAFWLVICFGEKRNRFEITEESEPYNIHNSASLTIADERELIWQ